VVETLTDEFDLMEVALAAVKLAHETTTGPDDDGEEVPVLVGKPVRSHRAGRAETRARRSGRTPVGGMTRLFFGVGRIAGVRPQDLVGAIAGESSLSGRDIGSIEIADRFSIVEVPQDAADEVIEAMRRSSIKGKRATVRRERDAPPKRPRR
jgi:ATP-dependent RNA helicase DeaD